MKGGANMKNKVKKFFLFFLIILTSLLHVACQYDTEEIVIGEGDWQSNEFYNQIAKVIIEEGYGKEVTITKVDTPLLVQSLKGQSIHVNTETWSDNIPTYYSDIEEGFYEELAVNFDDNIQGIFIPKYLADEYDIEYIEDLVDHKELFPDPDTTGWDPDVHKALVYGGTDGWAVTEFLINKFNNYEVYPDLVENFNFRPIDSTAILNSILTNKYNNEEPWVGYNWMPTAIMGKLDMVMLKDEHPYDFEQGTGNPPTNNVTVVATKGFRDDYPEITAFLENFQTSSQVASDALAYMEENELSAAETAQWWLKNNVSYWEEWVNEDVVNKVLDAIG